MDMKGLDEEVFVIFLVFVVIQLCTFVIIHGNVFIKTG